MPCALSRLSPPQSEGAVFLSNTLGILEHQNVGEGAWEPVGRVSGPVCGWGLNSGVSDLDFEALMPFPCPPTIEEGPG